VRVHTRTVPSSVQRPSLSPSVFVRGLLSKVDGRWMVDRTRHMTIHLYGRTHTTVRRAPIKARAPSRSFHHPFPLANPSDSSPDRLNTPTDDATSASSMAITPETVRNVPPDRLLRYETRTSKSPLPRKKLSTNIFGKSFRMLPHPLVYLKSALRVPPRISNRGPAPRTQVT